MSVADLSLSRSLSDANQVFSFTASVIFWFKDVSQTPPAPLSVYIGCFRLYTPHFAVIRGQILPGSYSSLLNYRSCCGPLLSSDYTLSSVSRFLISVLWIRFMKSLSSYYFYHSLIGSFRAVLIITTSSKSQARLFISLLFHVIHLRFPFGALGSLRM